MRDEDCDSGSGACWMWRWKRSRARSGPKPPHYPDAGKGNFAIIAPCYRNKEPAVQLKQRSRLQMIHSPEGIKHVTRYPRLEMVCDVDRRERRQEV